MDYRITRRGFLHAGAGLAAYGAPLDGSPAPPRTARDVPISATLYTPVPDYPIRAIPYSEVTIKDGFWKPKIETNARVTIPFEMQKLAQSASARNFGGGVLEASILSLKTHPDARLLADVDARIRAMKESSRIGNSTFEIAATHYLVTGKRDLLDHAVQLADVLYGDFERRSPPFSGGERDAINCVQLYRVTGDRKHLDLAKHYLDIRGLDDSVNRSRHNQSYKPVLEQSEAVGHAVNCASLMVSLIDVGTLTGLKEYYDAGHRMWQDAAARKMYITGGIGSTGNEGFGPAYSLPNISAYSETCAVLMFITLNHRLFLATGDSKFIDVMERGMYNNAIDGVSASGNRFFYVNRLASAGDGRDTRWERASLECCPPNLVRFLASMPGFVFAQSNHAQDRQGTIFVNLYVSSEAAFHIDGQSLSLAMDSEMPWGGKSKIRVSTRQRVSGNIRLRIPGWARNRPDPGNLYKYAGTLRTEPRIFLNGTAVQQAVDSSGYVSLDRQWADGDLIEIEFPFEVRRVIADENVKENRRRTAIERGPIVYCAEWPDVEESHPLELMLDSKAELKPAADHPVYTGIPVIHTRARNISNPLLPAKSIQLIPYYLWANRGAGQMSVWLSTAGYQIGDTGPAGGLIFYENPNFATDGWRYLEAAPFDQSAGARWGCFRKAIAGARGMAIGTGRQNTKDMLATCPEADTAAALCANYDLNGVRGWFLPSKDELAALYRGLGATEAGVADNFSYWTSSQDTADMASHIDFADNGRQHSDDKDFPRRVRAIRAF